MQSIVFYRPPEQAGAMEVTEVVFNGNTLDIGVKIHDYQGEVKYAKGQLETHPWNVHSIDIYESRTPKIRFQNRMTLACTLTHAPILSMKQWVGAAMTTDADVFVYLRHLSNLDCVVGLDNEIVMSNESYMKAFARKSEKAASFCHVVEAYSDFVKQSDMAMEIVALQEQVNVLRDIIIKAKLADEHDKRLLTLSAPAIKHADEDVEWVFSKQKQFESEVENYLSEHRKITTPKLNAESGEVVMDIRHI